MFRYKEIVQLFILLDKTVISIKYLRHLSFSTRGLLGQRPSITVVLANAVNDKPVSRLNYFAYFFQRGGRMCYLQSSVFLNGSYLLYKTTFPCKLIVLFVINFRQFLVAFVYQQYRRLYLTFRPHLISTSFTSGQNPVVFIFSVPNFLI